MEIRTRAAALLQKIEGSLLTMPTMVWLNFKDAPLADVVQALGQQTGMKVSLFPENLPRWKQEHSAFKRHSRFLSGRPSIGSVPRPRYSMTNCAGFSTRNQPTLVLTDRITRPVHPTSDHGPFRVSLVGLEFQRHVGFAVVMPRVRGNPGQAERPAAKQDLAPPLPRPVTSVQCSVQLQVTAQPPYCQSTGPLQILRRHDQGPSLRMENPGHGCSPQRGLSGRLLQLGSPRPNTTQPAREPGRTIKILRGSVPLRITARQPNPLVVPLATAAGKAFGSSDLHVLVHEVRANPNTHQRHLELTVRVTRSGGLPASDGEATPGLGSRFDPHQQNIEIIDTRGHVVPWFQTTALTWNLPASP